MKQALFVLIISTLVFGLLTGAAGAQQQAGKDVIMRAGDTYNPKIVYSGNHGGNILFMKNSKQAPWRRIPGLDRLRQVTCADALMHLQQEGTWQGHLNLDGSCGSLGEPSDWAMGNRINYDNQFLGQGVQGK
jgi:hypothetical protein